MKQPYTLAALSCGESAVISAIGGSGPMHERLRDLGFNENSVVTCLFAAALGDPRAYRIKGTVIALRQKDAQMVKCCTIGGDA